MSERACSLRLPALRGNDPLGFLAAVGLVAFAEQMPEAVGPLRMRWEGSRVPIACVESTSSSVQELGECLRAGFVELREQGRVVPGVPRHYPIVKLTGAMGSDPMRMSPADSATQRQAAFDEFVAGSPWFARWTSGLVAPVALQDGKDFLGLTQFYAVAGQMSLRGNYEKAYEAVECVNGPTDALVDWRRVKGFQGANFDERAVRTADVATAGGTDPYGAPSPTLLALQSLRLWPVVDDGKAARTTGWQRIALYRGFTKRSLIWPTWSEPLDAAALRTLLSLPILNDPAASRAELERHLHAATPRLRGHAIEAVFGSSRRTADQGDGPLGPAVRLWPTG